MNTAQAIALSGRNFGRSSVSFQGCISSLLIHSGAAGMKYVSALGGSMESPTARKAGAAIYYGDRALARSRSAGRNARALRRLARA